MRKITVGKKGSDPKTPGTPLPGEKPAAGEGADAVRKPSPAGAVDVHRVGSGRRSSVTDRPGPHAADSASIGGDAFGSFAEQALAGLEQVSARVRAGHAARLVEQKDLVALLDSAPLKRALEADPELRAQVAAALQVFKQDQELPQEAEETMAALKAMADTELAALGKLLG